MGHAKSICINFGLGRNYGGVCHLRCDDTDPEKEDTEYINGIIDSVRWRGFDRGQNAKTAPKPSPTSTSCTAVGFRRRRC